MSEFNYYNWFKKTINVFIYLFFIFSFLSNIFVYTSILKGIAKYIVLLLLILVVTVFIYYFKNKIKNIINKLINYLEKVTNKKTIIIIVLTSVLLKIIYYIFFFFDSTLAGGDITIYTNIADSIVENGINSIINNIYYLAGMGIHLSSFKIIGIPYHLGIYIVFLIGTIINYYSFSSLIGKEKSFVLIELYLLMPSTSLLTFCITHELFVYLYFSLILFVLNKFIINTESTKSIVYSFILLILILLNQTVSPIGKIWFIVLGLLILLTNIKINKKIVLLFVVVLSLLFSNVFSTKLEGNIASQSNNIEQLLIGCDLESMGRHTDGKGKREARMYWASKGVELTYENLVEGEKGVLIEKYKYLITHPIKLIELLANKFYTVWSGDFYSIEYAYLCNGIGKITYYIMLVLSALIWLFVITCGIAYYEEKEDSIYLLNYKLVLLGIMAVLLITEVTNKYSCYMTIFIYFIAFARTNLNGGNSND